MLTTALKSKDKKAKKAAKDYFKRYPDHQVDTTFNSLASYVKAVARVKEAIECQPVISN